MIHYEITKDEFDTVVAFVNHEGSTPAPEVVNKFTALTEAFSRRLFEEMKRLQGEKHNLEWRNERLVRKVSKSIEAEEFAELEFDSAQVAAAIAYKLHQTELRFISKQRIVNILFEVYSRWLSDNSERITVEHPVATEWGVSFWRAYKAIQNPSTFGTREDFEAVAARNPGVAALISNSVRKYVDLSDDQHKERIKTSLPYKEAMKKTGGKPNSPMADKDIYFWKK